MPRYSFFCKKCKNKFSINVNFENLKSSKCPGCTSDSIDRIFNFIGQEVSRDQEEVIRRAKEEAKMIVKKIKSGDQNAISEIYGGES